jgi:hypothetical protein
MYNWRHPVIGSKCNWPRMVGPQEECRYSLAIGLELCNRKRASTNDPIISNLIDLPKELQAHIVSFTYALRPPSAYGIYSSLDYWLGFLVILPGFVTTFRPMGRNSGYVGADVIEVPSLTKELNKSEDFRAFCRGVAEEEHNPYSQKNYKVFNNGRSIEFIQADDLKSTLIGGCYTGNAFRTPLGLKHGFSEWAIRLDDQSGRDLHGYHREIFTDYYLVHPILKKKSRRSETKDATKLNRWDEGVLPKLTW